MTGRFKPESQFMLTVHVIDRNFKRLISSKNNIINDIIFFIVHMF